MARRVSSRVGSVGAGGGVSVQVIDLAGPQLERFVEILISEAMPAAGAATQVELAKILRGRVPRGETGVLGSPKGIAPRGKPKVSGTASVRSTVGLMKAGFYGRFQNDGWKYHTQGKHFFEESEPDAERIGHAELDTAVVAALRESGLGVGAAV